MRESESENERVCVYVYQPNLVNKSGKTVLLQAGV